MRSIHLLYYLLILLFFVMVLVAPVAAASEKHQPTLIIPTKYRYLIQDMAQSVLNTPNPSSSTQVTLPVQTASAQNSVATGISGMDEKALMAALTPDQSYSGYGRGFVQTNFDVSFEESGRRIDNRERLTARGLFDVHVTHALN